MTQPASTEPMDCDHECVCGRYKNSYFGVRHLPCDTKITGIVCDHDTRARGSAPIGEHAKVIRELRNALFVAANRYHELHNRCAYTVQNELQFRSLVESALSESEKFKPDYETGDPLDWRRRHE